MIKATIKIPSPGLTKDMQYDVDKIVFDEILLGRAVTAVYLKKYLTKEKKDYKIIVIPIDYVEITTVIDEKID